MRDNPRNESAQGYDNDTSYENKKSIIRWDRGRPNCGLRRGIRRQISSALLTDVEAG
jgi:hypothetical protein